MRLVTANKTCHIEDTVYIASYSRQPVMYIGIAKQVSDEPEVGSQSNYNNYLYK